MAYQEHDQLQQPVPRKGKLFLLRVPPLHLFLHMLQSVPRGIEILYDLVQSYKRARDNLGYSLFSFFRKQLDQTKCLPSAPLEKETRMERQQNWLVPASLQQNSSFLTH